MASFGLHTTVAIWLLNMLEHMTFPNKLGNKTSDLTYPSKDDNNQGLEQGSLYAGAGWTFTDAKITDNYRSQARPLIMACPQKEIVVEKSSEAFVDDRTLMTEAKDGKTLRDNVQSDVILLQQSLEHTGGAMNINKSSWTCIMEDDEEILKPIKIPRPEYERKKLDDLVEEYRKTPTFTLRHEIELITSYPLEGNIEEYLSLHRDHIILRQNKDTAALF